MSGERDKVKNKKDEETMQIAFFESIHGTKIKFGLNQKWKLLNLIYSCASGMYLPVQYAAKAKRLGSKVKGVWDVNVPFAHIWIEFKSEKGTLTPEQIHTAKILSLRGDKFYIFRNENDAINFVTSLM